MPETQISRLTHAIRSVLERSDLFPGEHLKVDVILNPESGVLSSPRAAESVALRFERFVRGLVTTLRDPNLIDVEFHETEGRGHATSLAEAIMSQPVRGVHLIISAGGDGTHSEVLEAAVKDPSVKLLLKGKVWFFRFPLGTGNDGADADSLTLAARALLGEARPGSAGHLVVRPTNLAPLYAFNIASVGLDAYVGLLTNRFKRSGSGDLYKTIADVLTLFYERIVRLSDSTIRWTDAEGNRSSLTRRFVLCAMGISGERTYGNNKPILPGFENVCAIETTGLIGKIRLKNIVYDGTHPGQPIVHMRTTSRLTIEYDGRLPLQRDGEATWLESENFPLDIELHNETIPVLEMSS